MDIKERRKQMTDLAMQIEDKDLIVEDIDRLLTVLVGDNVTSDFGQMVYLLNPQENIMISNSQMAVFPQAVPLEGEEPEPLLTGGIGLQFQDPMLLDDTHGSSITVTNRMMIRSMEALKKEMLREQAKLEKQLTKLVETKKGDSE